MSTLRVLAKTARTVSVLMARTGARFSQPTPVGWRLLDASGNAVASGQATTASVFVDGLEPDCVYVLKTEIGDLDVRTATCAGQINAADFGADPRAANNQPALQAAIAAVPEGGTLMIPAGRYQTGPIFLKPRMTLLIADGAEVSAQSGRAGWPQLPAHDPSGRVIGTWEGVPAASFAAVVTAIDCDRLAITGRGIIDGGGDRADWWDWPKETREGARRPRTLHLAYCDAAQVTGVTVRNSPSWTVHPYRCRNLHVSSIRIENPPNSPNTDGLNPESCETAEITGVDFSVGDDCIAIKAGKRVPQNNDHLAQTRDIAISHCRMRRGHGAVVLGSEMSGGISNVSISMCEFVGTDRGLRLKTRRGRGGVIENIAMTDVDMDTVATPLAINAFYFCDPDGGAEWVQSRNPAPVDQTTPKIRNITLTRVTAKNVSLAAAAILGLPEAAVEDVRIDDFAVSYDPDAKADVPLMAHGVQSVRHAGVVAEFAHVKGSVHETANQTDTVTC